MKMTPVTLIRSLAFATGTAAVFLVLGCGIGAPAGPEMLPGADISGLVHGGQNPVSSSNVALFATGKDTATGYTPPNAYGSTPLFLARTTTDANGNFNFSGTTYTCPTDDDVYIIATGGDPGLTPSTTDNSAIFLVAALGTCANLPTIPTITINEATTVAAAYALGGFAPAGGAGMTEAAVIAATVAAPGPGITSTTSNNQGLLDAFSNALNISNIQAGTIYSTTPSGGTATSNIANALADILQDCVNSSGPGSTPCTNLFAAATPPGASPTTPANSWQAALNIVQYPGNKVATLFGYISAQAAFPESLTAAPNDWSYGVTYTSSLLYSPQAIVADASDNIYVTGSYNASAPAVDAALVKFSSVGGSPTDLVTTTQLSASDGSVGRYAAVDKSGNIWLSDHAAAAQVDEYSSGTVTSPAYTTVDTDTNNYGIAADGDGDIWTSSYKNGGCGTGKSICELVEFADKTNTTYTPFVTFGTYTVTSPGVGGSRDVVYDAKRNNVWLSDINESDVQFFPVSPTGTNTAASAAAAATLFTLGTGTNDPQNFAYGSQGVAIDKSGNAWVVVVGGPAVTTGTNTTNAVNSALYEIAASTTATPALISGGSFNSPAYDVIDGNNNVFIANSGSSTTTDSSAVLEYNTTLSSFVSPNIGFAPGATYTANGVGTCASTVGCLSADPMYKAGNILVDRSGALWLLSGSNATTSQGSLTQILGVAAPTDPVLADGVYGTKP
jgi:hypothetical protein